MKPLGSAAPAEALDARARMPRRRFLVGAGCTAVAALVGEGLRAALEERPLPAGSIDLARSALPAPGDALAVTLEPAGIEALVLNTTAVGLVAFDRRCPHLGCPVLWSRDHARLECPCHAAWFEAATGEVGGGPPPRGLTKLNIEVGSDGGIRVATRPVRA